MLSVVLATRDRAPILRRTLDALARLEAPPGGWQLIAVDNGSSDGTASLLGEYAQRLPLTPIHEPRPGKSRALNAALPALRGAYLVRDLGSARMWALWLPPPGGADARAEPLGHFAGRMIATFGRDAAGDLYAADFGSGELFAILAK